MLRALFLQAPSFDGFDGGAGSRYQAKREIRSFWFPTWLAQPAALVPGSKLIDAPPAGISLKQVVDQANDFDMVVIHTSVPSFESDVKSLADRHRSVILCSHDFALLERVADRVLLLNRGALGVDAGTSELIDEYGSLDNMVREILEVMR